jgi:hypothetical protein
MPGQGKVTKQVVSTLFDSGWTVLFSCIPNTPHVGVVPITVFKGTSRQRYPDVAATRNGKIWLIEVEMHIDAGVASDIRTRFREMRDSLQDGEIYRKWRGAIFNRTQVELPDKPVILLSLVVCSVLNPASNELVRSLDAEQISVCSYQDFSALEYPLKEKND